MEWAIELKRNNTSPLLYLILLSALIFLSFGIIGYYVSDQVIKSAKDEHRLEKHPPHHRPRGRRHGPPPPRMGPGRNAPQVWGMTPENFSTVIFFISLLLGFLCCSFALISLYRRTAQTASYVLSELKKGNLSTRFPVSPFEPSQSITLEFNEMANEIEKLVTTIRENEEERSSLFQELAHDIRTPVTGLRSLIETIHEHGNSMSQEQLSEFTSSSLAECNYIARLVEDLLFISGVKSVQHLEDFTSINIANLIEEEASLFENIELNVDTQSGTLNGNPYLLKRLFRNALENAVSFAKAHVEINLKEDKEVFSISIIDDGPGLSSRALKDYGKKSFARKQRSVKQDANRLSIGLGSFIIDRIAHLHKGNIIMENLVKEDEILGAKLTIHLPKNKIASL